MTAGENDLDTLVVHRMRINQNCNTAMKKSNVGLGCSRKSFSIRDEEVFACFWKVQVRLCLLYYVRFLSSTFKKKIIER